MADLLSDILKKGQAGYQAAAGSLRENIEAVVALSAGELDAKLFCTDAFLTKASRKTAWTLYQNLFWIAFLAFLISLGYGATITKTSTLIKASVVAFIFSTGGLLILALVVYGGACSAGSKLKFFQAFLCLSLLTMPWVYIVAILHCFELHAFAKLSTGPTAMMLFGLAVLAQLAIAMMILLRTTRAMTMVSGGSGWKSWASFWPVAVLLAIWIWAIL